MTPSTTLFVCVSGTRKSFDHLISDTKAPKRPEMESGITTPPKMRRVAENDYEIGVIFVCGQYSEEKMMKWAVCMRVVIENKCGLSVT